MRSVAEPQLSTSLTQFRIYAENPVYKLMSFAGTVAEFVLYNGYQVQPFHESQVTKLVA